MTELLHKDLTGAIIKAYYEVFNHTSRTYPEVIYERALMRELQQQGYEVTRQDEYQILYKNRVVGRQRLDLFVVREIVVEKVIGDIAHDHLVVDGRAMVFPFAVTDIRSVHLDNIKDWMRMNDLRLGIIANFNAVRLQTVIVRT